MTGRARYPRSRRRGGSLIEFTLVAVLTVLMVLSSTEMARMVLVYTTVSNAARAGIRYGIVHGTPPTGSCIGGCHACPTDHTPLDTVVKNFASAGLLDTTRLIVNPAWPDGDCQVGQRITVTVVYPYDPLVSFFPLRVRLGSTTQGIFAF